MIFLSVWTCHDLSDVKWNHGFGVPVRPVKELLLCLWRDIGLEARIDQLRPKTVDHLNSSPSFLVHFPMYQCD